MKIADVRVLLADIPVKPAHKGDPDHRPVFITAETDTPLGTWGNDTLAVRRLILPLSDQILPIGFDPATPGAASAVITVLRWH